MGQHGNPNPGQANIHAVCRVPPVRQALQDWYHFLCFLRPGEPTRTDLSSTLNARLLPKSLSSRSKITQNSHWAPAGSIQGSLQVREHAAFISPALFLRRPRPPDGSVHGGSESRPRHRGSVPRSLTAAPDPKSSTWHRFLRSGQGTAARCE